MLTIGLELVFLYVVVYFCALLGKDHVILCSVHGIRNSTGLEGLSDHFLGHLCPCGLDPTELNKISAWRLLLASWGELKWPRYHPCQVLSAHIFFKGLVEVLIQGLHTRGSASRDICHINVSLLQVTFH